MKRLFTFLILIAIGFGIYWFVFRGKSSRHHGPKQAPIALKKHSPAFNAQVDQIMEAYLQVKDKLVVEDTAGARQQVQVLMAKLDSFPLDELKKDTALIYETVRANLNDIKANAGSFLQQTNITEMRRDFKAMTDVMYPSFFRSINYEGRKLYLQHCPMAFGQDQGADWISHSTEIVNPYLGNKHPEYKDGMLHCGEVKDTIKAQ